MRIYGIVQDSIVDGPGLRFVCFVQGCPHNCPGCHNPDSHDPAGGAEITTDEVIAQMLSNPLTDGLTLSGGEPFEQAVDCLRIAETAHDNGLNVWCYTGYTYEQLLKHGTGDQIALLAEVDVLIDGRYIEDLRTLSLPWRGSSNQRVIRMDGGLTHADR